MDDKTIKEIIDNIFHRGIIAKITAAVVIIMVSLSLVTSFDCMENANMVLPVLSGVLCTSMTYLFVKKDGKN